MASPPDWQKDPQLCSVTGSVTVFTLRYEIGILGLSIKLSRTIRDFPNDPHAGPSQHFLGGEQKYILAPPKFCMGE